MADVVVIGLGAVGAAAIFQLARRGVRAVGIDRFAPPHARGSSHGETRVTRQAIGEGEALVPFALRAHDIWREIEARTGAALLETCGCLVIADPDDATRRHGAPGFLARTAAAARRFGVAHEMLCAADIRRRFPQFRVGERDVGYFEPGGGYVRPEACIAAQLALAREAGATLRLDERVTRLTPGAASVEIETTRGVLSAGAVIVSAGPWAAALVGPAVAPLLRPTRQTLHWRAAETPDWARGPTFIWMQGEGPFDFVYGFPALGGEVKSATESDDDADPDSDARGVAPGEAAAFIAARHAGRLAGLGPVTRSISCLYTQTPDGGFLIDAHPDSARILIASPCSGHGFKHSPAIGEALAQRLVDGASRLDLSPFALARFAA